VTKACNRLDRDNHCVGWLRKCRLALYCNTVLLASEIIVINYRISLWAYGSMVGALRLTRPLTEMSARNIPVCKGRLVHRDENLSAICEPTVKKMLELQCLTTHGLP
jgi:hypothetical protein